MIFKRVCGWIFEDLMPGDVFKCISGGMCGTRMTLTSIDYKGRSVTLTYPNTDFGMRSITLNEKDFKDRFVLHAWH